MSASFLHAATRRAVDARPVAGELDTILAELSLTHLSDCLSSLTFESASTIAISSRPELLLRLKGLGCDKLAERQALVNAISRKFRRSMTSSREQRSLKPPTHAYVINLASRHDRRAAFAERWPSDSALSATILDAVDGKALLQASSAPSPPDGCDPLLTSQLRRDWRANVCANDAAWGANMPRKLASVVACHVSHLNVWEMLLARGGDAPMLVFEDDASFAVSDVSTWFRDTLLPQLPDDWAFCYLNEPLHLEMNRERSHRQPAAQHQYHMLQQQHPQHHPHPQQQQWRVVCASDESHEYTACLRHVYVSGDAETLGMMPYASHRAPTQPPDPTLTLTPPCP